MTNPDLVMLDEPMAGVNPALKQSLNEHVRGLRDEGMTVLFVEHDMDMVHDISDWVVVMAEGQVIAEGTPDQISSNTAVIDAYLGTHQGQVAAGGSAMSESERSVGPRRDGAGGRVHPRGQHPQRLQPGRSTQGEFVGIIGPNGAGKSTLLKAVLGQCPIRSGTVTLGDTDITGQQAHELVPLGVGYVPQNKNVFPSLTVQGEPRDGLLPAPVDVRRALRVRHRAVPAPARAGRAAGRFAVRWRAPDGGDGSGADARADGAVARRAVSRPLADAPGRGVRAVPAHQRDRASRS